MNNEKSIFHYSWGVIKSAVY